MLVESVLYVDVYVNIDTDKIIEEKQEKGCYLNTYENEPRWQG